ncbi:MAG: hypothetical protein V2J62_01450 [candidate division KSB1 bacterium]|nr:hypothetical protein [candidate division KSB1 bacterium]
MNNTKKRAYYEKNAVTMLMLMIAPVPLDHSLCMAQTTITVKREI